MRFLWVTQKTIVKTYDIFNNQNFAVPTKNMSGNFYVTYYVLDTQKIAYSRHSLSDRILGAEGKCIAKGVSERSSEDSSVKRLLILTENKDD